MEEIRSHTSLRGIAALLVAIYHFRSGLNPFINLDQYTHFFSKGYLWVDFFFILSGFILCHVYATRPGESRNGAGKFLWARFARIYPLHIATLLFMVGLQVILSLKHKDSVHFGEWYTFWLNVLNVHGWGILSRYDWNFPSWSISVEMAAYLTFPLICLGLLRAPKYTYYFMGAVIALRVTYLVTADDPRAGWERMALASGFPMFFIGVLLYQLRGTARRMSERSITFMQVIALISTALVLDKGGNDALIIGPFALLVFSTQNDNGVLSKLLTSKFILTLGLWSYSIYLLHVCVMRVLDQAWPKFIAIPFGLTVNQSAAGLFLVSIITTISAASFSYNKFETPCRRALRNISFAKNNMH